MPNTGEEIPTTFKKVGKTRAVVPRASEECRIGCPGREEEEEVRFCGKKFRRGLREVFKDNWLLILKQT